MVSTQRPTVFQLVAELGDLFGRVDTAVGDSPRVSVESEHFSLFTAHGSGPPNRGNVASFTVKLRGYILGVKLADFPSMALLVRSATRDWMIPVGVTDDDRLTAHLDNLTHRERLGVHLYVEPSSLRSIH